MESFVVRIGPKGRVVVPAEIRRQLQLKEGTELVARVSRDRLVLESRPAALRRLRGFFDDVSKDVDLAADVIAERRRDARSEK